MKIVIGWNKPNETPARKMNHGLNKNTCKLKHSYLNRFSISHHVYRFHSTSGPTYNDTSRSSFISVISNGSTDKPLIEQEMLLVRYVINGEINDKYVAIQPSDRIMKFIKTLI